MSGAPESSLAPATVDAVFKAYDVRGLAPSQIDPALARATGRAHTQVTGAATVVGASAGLVAYVDGTGAPVDLPPAATGYGFDFNPTVDRIRVVTGSGLNLRINPNDGNPVDGNLANMASPPAGINPDGMINGASGEAS